MAGALEQNDALCLEVLECFCGMLGGAAANLAVTLGAFGGIFIGGGIVPRMGEWFASSPFRARFEAKGRFSDYLADIPTYVITTPNPAFHGVATILSEHLRGRSGANTLMERITHLRHELTPAEQRVASLVLEQPRLVLNEPIAEIARLADVSQPTVIRFCRSLGFLGLADFKLKFASSLTGAIPVRHSQVRTERQHARSVGQGDRQHGVGDPAISRPARRALARPRDRDWSAAPNASSSTRWAIRARWRSTASTSSSASGFRPRCTATRICSRWPPNCWGRAMW